MSSRFSEQVETKNCKTCGETIKSRDKLKIECRECVLERERNEFCSLCGEEPCRCQKLEDKMDQRRLERAEK